MEQFRGSAGMIDVDSEDTIEWLPAASSDGIRIGRRGPRVVVEWQGLGRLSSSNSGSDGEFTAFVGANPAILEKFRVTSLLACRRYLAGRLSLHASAVGVPGGCIALVGDSGSGKSTTAMALVERHGGRFLADDIVPVDWDGASPVVCPVEDSFWLNSDALAWFGLRTSSKEKNACLPRARSGAPERLAAIVHLVFDETVEGASIQVVTGQDAFGVLSRAHVCYSVGGDEDALRNFAARERLAAATTVFRLRRRRALGTLVVATHLLEEHLSGL